MRTKQWLRQIFGSKGDFRAVYFLITVPLAIIGPIVGSILTMPPHWLTYLLYAPFLGVLIGFIVCSFTAFSRAHDRAEAAERRLSGLSIDVTSVTAGEYVYPKDIMAPRVKAHHSVVIELALAVRNHDGENTCSIELLNCTTDLRSEPCDKLGFERGIYNNIVEDEPGCRTIPNGVIRPLVVSVLYNLPISATHIAATKVTGVLELRDNRKTPLTVPFSSDLTKNPVQLINRSYKAIRREEGKQDVVTHFPSTASPADAVRWCETDGYKVIGHEIINTPEDENCISTTIVTVESKVPPVVHAAITHYPVKPDGDE